MAEEKADILQEPEDFQREVIAQYEAVRKSKLTNMFDEGAVLELAEENGFEPLRTAIDGGMYTSILLHYNDLISMISSGDVPEMSWSGVGTAEERKEVSQQIDRLFGEEDEQGRS